MFDRIGYKVKLQLLGLAVLVFMLPLLFFAGFTTERSIIEGRRDRTRRVVETAAGVADHFAREAEAGHMTMPQAQAAALGAIKALRYDGEQYFWINDFDARVVMHPMKPELDGKDLSAFEDPAGKRIFREFADVGRTKGAGFVAYLWPKPGAAKPVKKISYVLAVPAWKWVVGSGIYLDDVAALIARQRMILFALALAAAVGAMVLTHTLAVRLTSALGRVVEQSRRAATGDLSVRVEVTSQDELGQLGNALNHMLVQFGAMLDEVQQAAATTASAAQQLSAGGQELASGAHQQAASLEETAAALHEMTTTVQKSAEGAQQASALARDTRGVAENGGAVVQRAVTAMREINQSSRRIADITSTIDEIAFQTNLLALNAAVEAARAGEQGRGFAVVASEVRGLAQRSAAAAREIKGLIEDSVHKVEAGTELVNRSGETLVDIVASVQRVADLVADIATATREQSASVQAVNGSVTQMDQVTQANAAQTEELAATARSLSDEAERLHALTTQFRLDGTRSAPRAVVAIARSEARPALAATGTDGAH